MGNFLISALLAIFLAGCANNAAKLQSTQAESSNPPVTQVTQPLRQTDDFLAAASRHQVIFDLPDWETSTTTIDQSMEVVIGKADALLDAIAALPPESQNFENTLAALDDAYYQVGNLANRINLISSTSREKALRDHALASIKKLSAWFVRTGFRKDVYQAVKRFADSQPQVTGEDALLLREILRGYRRNGMMLSDAEQKTLAQLKTELSEMGIEFARNIRQANDTLEFTREELAGLPETFLANPSLLTAQGNYRINSNVSWQVGAVLDNANSEETRRRISKKRANRARDVNTPLFTRMLKHRARIAELLGYAHWADYRIETKMAKTAATAYAFEESLAEGLEPKFQAELELLRQMKAEETGDPEAELKRWDTSYYTNQLKKSRYQIDDEKLKVFFQTDRVLEGMFSIFEELFGLRIEAVAPPYAWVEDLQLYAVSDSQTSEPLGFIYMDLYPRDGKYNHFAQFHVTDGKLLNNGKYQRPVVALICNFPPAGETTPSLLKFSEVETLFHEFGHALHSVLTQAKYASFSGTSVPRDFVEAPSQMLENWLRDKTVLDRFAADYRDSEKKLPPQILEKMEQARLATVASSYRRQLAYGMLDLELHMTRDEDVFNRFVEVSNGIIDEVFLALPEDTAFAASFGHLGGGYDAGYYGYAWADAISADLASVFRASPGGFMDPTVGRRLRDEIYAPGGSREIEESIEAFLGRPRSLDAFFEYIGMSTK